MVAYPPGAPPSLRGWKVLVDDTRTLPFNLASVVASHRSGQVRSDRSGNFLFAVTITRALLRVIAIALLANVHATIGALPSPAPVRARGSVNVAGDGW